MTTTKLSAANLIVEILMRATRRPRCRPPT